MNFRALVAVTVVFGFGCGVSVDAPLLMTCDIQSSHTCQEWRGDKMHETNANVNFDSLCTADLRGTAIMGECPSGFVGVCTKRPSVAKRVIQIHYYSPEFDVSSATNDCTGQSGSFSSM